MQEHHEERTEEVSKRKPTDPAQPALAVEFVPVEDLVPYAGNAKLHPEEQVRQLAESIERFGNCDPIGVWTNPEGRMEIVEGHGRVMALKALGREEAPVIRLDHLDDDARRAYTHVHNQTTLSSGFDMEALAADLESIDGFEWEDFGFEPSAIGLEPVEVFQDDVPEREDVEPRVHLGEIWRLGDHVLLCGDATHHEDVMRLVEAGGGLADMLLTDPPYNVSLGTDESGHKLRPSEMAVRRRRTDGKVIANDAFRDAEQFIAFLEAALGNANGAIREGASFYVWLATTRAKEFIEAMGRAGLEIKQELYWVKNTFVLGRQDYQWQTEPCFYGWKDGAAHWFAPTRSERNVIEDGIDTERMSKADLKAALDAILAGYETDAIHEDRPSRSEQHPTMKPVPLFARFMRNSSRPGERVLDVFAGSGTTVIAAEQMGRKAMALELDPRYCDVIVSRWESLTGRVAERLVG